MGVLYNIEVWLIKRSKVSACGLTESSSDGARVEVGLDLNAITHAMTPL